MSKQPLLYEVWRVCRETDIADLMAAFIDQDDAEGYAHEFVETDRFDALIRATAADAVVNYTERVDRAHEHLIARLSQFNGIQPPEVIKAIYRYRDAVASERDAAHAAEVEQAYRVGKTFGSVEALAEHQAEIAALKHDISCHQAAASSEAEAHSALLARLWEPNVREALSAELRPYLHETLTLEDRETVLTAALTKITEMLTP